MMSEELNKLTAIPNVQMDIVIYRVRSTPKIETCPSTPICSNWRVLVRKGFNILNNGLWFGLIAAAPSFINNLSIQSQTTTMPTFLLFFFWPMRKISRREATSTVRFDRMSVCQIWQAACWPPLAPRSTCSFKKIKSWHIKCFNRLAWWPYKNRRKNN